MIDGNKRTIITAEEFGKRLKKQRETAGYKKPRNLALAMCGFQPDTKGLFDTEQHRVAKTIQNIRNWERGDNFPSSIQEFAKLCTLLDCDPDYLLYEDSVYPHKEVQSIVDATGLSNDAAESLLGIHRYGPINSLKALDTVLQHEQMWNFLGRREETISGINLLWHIGLYLSEDRAPNHYLVYIDDKMGYPENRVEISASNYINHGEPLATLYDRAILDTIIDGLKEIRKEGSKKP